MKKAEEKLKKKYLELLEQGYHKKDASQKLGVDLIMVRSWRMKDPAFNRLCKNFTRGKEDVKAKVDKKEQFIALLSAGVSQREASRQLEISLPVIRTWKKNDSKFKEMVLKKRFK